MVSSVVSGKSFGGFTSSDLPSNGEEHKTKLQPKLSNKYPLSLFIDPGPSGRRHQDVEVKKCFVTVSVIYLILERLHLLN